MVLDRMMSDLQREAEAKVFRAEQLAKVSDMRRKFSQYLGENGEEGRLGGCFSWVSLRVLGWRGKITKASMVGSLEKDERAELVEVKVIGRGTQEDVQREDNQVDICVVVEVGSKVTAYILNGKNPEMSFRSNELLGSTLEYLVADRSDKKQAFQSCLELDQVVELIEGGDLVNLTAEG